VSKEITKFFPDRRACHPESLSSELVILRNALLAFRRIDGLVRSIYGASEYRGPSRQRALLDTGERV